MATIRSLANHEEDSPRDWETVLLGEVASFGKGQGLPKSALKETGALPCIHYGELFTDYGAVIGKVKSRTDGFANATLSVAGDVLMPTSDVTPEGLATASCVLDANVILGGDILAIRPNPSRVFGPFLSYALRAAKTQILRLVTGTTVRHIYASDLRGLALRIPHLSEQHRIAKALGEIDSLWEAHRSLAEKKALLKTALMQRLLTGEMRLPGFTGSWESRRLGGVVDFRKGSMITSKEVVPGPIPVIAGGKKPACYHNVANRPGETITVSASGAGAGFVSFHQKPIFASDCTTIEANPHYSVEFVYYQLLLRQEDIYKMQTGGAQPHIHAKDLAPLEIFWPAKDEQEAISQVLRTLDVEIEALAAQTDKTQKVKQALMDNLLTGKIRLPTP